MSRLNLYHELNSDKYSGVILTSASAMRSFDIMLDSIREHISPNITPSSVAITKLPCYCVGKATANSAIARGFTNVITPEDPTGNAIVLTAFLNTLKMEREASDTISAHNTSVKLTNVQSFDPEKPLLVLTCPQRLDTLTSRLLQFNIAHVELFSYSSKPKSAIDLANNISTALNSLDEQNTNLVLTFFSPSGVASVDDALRLPPETPHLLLTTRQVELLKAAAKVSIGATTQNAILRYSQIEKKQLSESGSSSTSMWIINESAQTPTPDGLIHAVQRCLQIEPSTFFSP